MVLAKDENRKLLSQTERSFAEKMALKKYYSRKLKVMENEKRAIDAYLKKYDIKIESAETLLEDTSSYKELLKPYFSSLSKELIDWMNSPYEKNPKNPEKLIHKTVNGLMVRSKSEAMIAKLLYVNKIPFRYECALHLPEKTIYPDFTIKHPKTGELFYWEHFGWMDNLNYCAYASDKFERYVMNGIIPSIHLITTYETKEHPFSIETAEELIKKFFL